MRMVVIQSCFFGDKAKKRKTKTRFLPYAGYQNSIQKRIKQDFLLILVFELFRSCVCHAFTSVHCCLVVT